MKNKTSQICTHQNVPPAGGLAVFCKKTDWGVCECTVPLSSFVRKGGGKIFDFGGGFDKSNKISFPYFLNYYQINKALQSIITPTKHTPRLPL